MVTEVHTHQWGPVEHSWFTGTPHRKCQVAGCRDITLDIEEDDPDTESGDCDESSDC